MSDPTDTALVQASQALDRAVAKVRVTDENGQRRHLRVPIEQVEAL